MNFTRKTGEKHEFHQESRRKTWIHMGFQLENWGWDDTFFEQETMEFQLGGLKQHMDVSSTLKN